MEDLTLTWLEEVPPFLADASDFQRTADVIAKEIGRFEDAVEHVKANYFPQTGDDLLLQVWERILGLSEAPPDRTLAQRQMVILAYLRGIKAGGSGVAWVEQMSALIGTGWEYEEHDPADPSSPPAHTLRFTLPFTPAISAPAQPTATPATTGGTLAAGTYRYVVTALNQYGETTGSPERSVATTGTTGRVTVGWAAVTDATGYRVYRSAVGAPVGGPYRLVAEVGAVLTYNDTGTATLPATPPATNATASPQAYEAEALAKAITPAHLDLVFGYGAGFIVGISQVGEEPL